MNNISLKQKSGVAFSGLAVTVIIWSLALVLDAVIVPEMAVVSWLKTLLLFLFFTDIIYLSVGSLRQLIKSGWGTTLATEGPYQFVRHPLYSGIIYSFTGLLALLQSSWSLLISVLPLSLFWSWLVQKEEAILIQRFGDKYRAYMDRTGQFFPTAKALTTVDGK